MTRILFLVSALLYIGCPWAADDMASALVRQTSERMLSVLEQRRADIERDPSLIYGLVDDIVVPHFDFEKMTRAAVGKHWRSASPDQKRALTAGFRELLVRTYATALLGYSGQQIRYLPVKPGRRDSTVTVSTVVSESGGPPIPVDYHMYTKAGSWKVFDVIIDHVSLVSNYRSSFNTQVRKSGVDGLIQRLGEMNAKGKK